MRRKYEHIIARPFLSGQKQPRPPIPQHGTPCQFRRCIRLLPRCFRRPITIRTCDDRVAFFPALEERTALISDVSGVRVYFVGERPRSGKWGSGSNSETEEDLLDGLSVNGRFTSVRINWDGDEVPFMKPNPWQVFCGGTERFFTIGRVY